MNRRQLTDDEIQMFRRDGVVHVPGRFRQSWCRWQLPLWIRSSRLATAMGRSGRPA